MLIVDCTLCRFKVAFSLVAKLVKNLPPMQETWVWRSSGEGNGNPLQYSCLENPMDRGVWWATVHGVARGGHDSASKPNFLLDALCFEFSVPDTKMRISGVLLVLAWHAFTQAFIFNFSESFYSRCFWHRACNFFSFENQLEVFLFWFLNIMHIDFLL